ncbi:IGR protein motif-domain-containing protein [Aspergillus tamarii]|uniref:Small ribosomal subunit protein mS41 n=1 Tax=Aspergillus tamarii TaxID=41984 RepID=A0A5N6UPU4_ASPTM|nr:IGR protein motif-domain-containing protein [Aspergillus tamarii]
MAMRSSFLLSSQLIRPLAIGKQCVRCFHKHASTPSVPSPTPFVPDVETFLTLIGRGMTKHASKLPSWEKLFTLSSAELRDIGIEPTRQRRYLLRKREKFRNGVFGPGGDLEHVVDGTAQLRVVEVPLATDNQISGPSNSSATLSPGMRKVIVNLPPDASEYTHDPSKPLKKFAHMKIHRGSMLSGPFLQPIKGTDNCAALIKVQEGMWEDKLGHKVDGGERRRAEVRAKKRSEERRKGTA